MGGSTPDFICRFIHLSLFSSSFTHKVEGGVDGILARVENDEISGRGWSAPRLRAGDEQ